MSIVIKRDDVVISADGQVAGHEAGDTLVRRLLRIFPGSVLVGPVARRGTSRGTSGFDVLPLGMIDPAHSVVINMDVVDSPQVYLALAGGSPSSQVPRIMNFVWRPVASGTDEVATAATALSCALFPTFANSERTASEIRELVQRWAVQPLAEKARLSWVNLGFRLDHIQPRDPADPPVVLYPAIYLSRNKRPDLFLEVVDRVRRQVPLRMEMRLHESHLVSERAMAVSRRDWAWVGPLMATRSSYWQALARTTAFLATAQEESYGLLYVEALGAGVVGVMPDRPWARALVPQGYPFLYRDAAQAEEMLVRALRAPQACRAQMDECADGSFASWIAAHHSDDAFDRAVVHRVQEWFGT
ncbi:glycosyltransferase family 1 protein [Actinomyces sp. 2119]|uniref:Glycosyltransferase family 1 protein n=1 Tax=Actinomyces lilanjuaniae TaxID=2321394 RepID=A0ABN5PP13_9ACTO|nr:MULTISPECIES: glycosyltransferase [Actinomyces]AYD90133.1 glycosyltransferase family 1 protein [Actinomyces lilanjuaniae]RJF41383.1 glycosyltransferase family 1 protein [Actinomyces sp. 2119]